MTPFCLSSSYNDVILGTVSLSPNIISKCIRKTPYIGCVSFRGKEETKTQKPR